VGMATASDRSFIAITGLRLSASGSAPTIPHRRLSGVRNEAATFALCYGPEDCSPSIGKDFYYRAFTPKGRP
jgi:hypothetical protein